MRNNGHACPSSGTQLSCSVKYSGLCVLLVSFCLAGCGGGEDFSKPPAQIQSQLGKAGEEPDSQSREEPDTSDVDAKVADAATSDPEAMPAQAADQSSESGVVPAETHSAESSETSRSLPAASPGAAADNGADPSAVASTGEEGTITASGKSAESIAEKKSANSKASVMGNAGGLLGSLKGGRAKATGNAPSSGSNPDPDAPAVTSRFGRLALSRIQWLQLVSQLTRQFFVASTPDGSGLAGSTGERSLEVLDTQLDVRSPTAATGNRSPRETAAPIHVPVSGLPGIINSLELTNDGQQILIGTTDGRLLVRSVANTSDWDLFARDLFLFQDEHRRTARLSDKAIVAVRCLPDDRFLTIDANGTCAFWNLTEAVLPVTPILEMTVEQAKAMEAETVPVTPMAAFTVSGFEILSITIADAQKLGTIVTSSEEVYVFRTDTGELIETLKAELFADTQPVCVEFIADGTEILAGLADGRILRRALAGSAAVTGIDDRGDTVDYESVFVPDVQDQISSITSIRAIPNSRAIYFGTIDGTVVRFDTAQKRIALSKKRHAAPVIDFLATPYGMLSIGGDRQAQLFDVPVTPQSSGQDSDVSFQLPLDETLEETVADDSQPQNAATGATGKSTRPTRTRAVEKPAEVDLSLAGIRPADATLALYEHQLRSATEPARQMDLRKQILRHRGANSLADSVGKNSGEVPDGPPLRVAEVTTQLQFSSDSWSRVLLAISDDGTTAAVLPRGTADRTEQQAIAGALSLYDMTTGAALRHWTQPEPARSLQLDVLNHLLFETTANTRYWISTGLADTDPMTSITASIASADSKHLFLGRAGTLGAAAPAVTRFVLSDHTEISGLELFESMITAMALSSSQDRLYVGTRERDQVRLLELNPTTLAIQQEIIRDPLSGRIPADTVDASQPANSGTILIQPSPSDKLLLTWGNYEGGSQLRLWRQGGSGWPEKDVIVIKAAEASPDWNAIDQPAKFVNQQDGRVAVVTTNGLCILSTRKLEVENIVPIPAVSGHRPPCVFSPDGKWLLAGDGDGSVWAMSLMSPDRKPLKFSAHTGPIAGLAISPNGRYLATIGEHNFLRSWRVDGFLKR